jgi:hypothetical protein
MLNELVSQPATAARAHYQLGLIWAQKGEYGHAVDELTRATVLGRKTPKPLPSWARPSSIWNATRKLASP